MKSQKKLLLAVLFTFLLLAGTGIWFVRQEMQRVRLYYIIPQGASDLRAAVTSFRDRYHALPGDMPNAAAEVPGCKKYGTACNPWRKTAGNGIIGDPIFSKMWKSQVTSKTTVPAASAADETVLFWTHLMFANFLGCVSNDSLKNNTPVAWHVTHCAAPLFEDTGYIVGHSDGSPFPRELSPASDGLKGPVLVLITGSVLRGEAKMNEVNKQPLTPHEAMVIDKKMDDAKPSSGKVQAYGASDCFAEKDGISVYNEATSMRVCGLVFQID